ncbi:NERD domain-containing protein [Haloferula sp.]|uniref:nuclease-related domain-containing DEAD/DEAH box helicase n=1 Tax=Haloferula sp. TaxID=2497595 RepID=UPI00329B86D3
MARWIIQRPQEHSHPAEVRVAEQLRELDDKWTVIWGYYYADKRGTEREGDFLVIGPAGGMLVLEVKNSLPRWFSATGRWEGEHDNPINQLMDEWSAVVGIVKSEDLPTWVAKALCVPGEEAPLEQETVQGLQRSLLVLGNDLADWLPRVWFRLFDWRVEFPVPLADQERLLNRFGASIDPKNTRSFLDHTEELFQRQLTHRFQLLDQLSGNRQLLVCGGTGTGKTWHAIEQASRYASSGKSVLFLVYNLALTTQLRRLIGMRKLENGSITVMGWEELFLQLARVDGDQMIPPEDDPAALREFYEQTLTGKVRALLDQPETHSDWPQFDALVADEAQDQDTAWDSTANGGWWDAYRALLHEGSESPASIFYDPAQRPPFRDPDRFDAADLRSGWSQPAHVRLQPALRYTRPLWSFFQQHRHPAINPMLDALGRGDHLPEGPEPELHSIDDGSALSKVEEIIARWKSDGLCRPDEVLILHRESSIQASALGDTRVIGGHNLRDVLEESDGAIRHTSINKAKGLDSRAVILIGCEPISESLSDFDAYTWFMGVSRARQLLAVIESSKP